VIPQGEIDPIGQAIINLYPKPNLPGEFNNFRTTALQVGGDYQFDIKVDHQLSSAQRLSARIQRVEGAGRFSGAERLSSQLVFGSSAKARGAVVSPVARLPVYALNLFA